MTCLRNQVIAIVLVFLAVTGPANGARGAFKASCAVSQAAPQGFPPPVPADSLKSPRWWFGQAFAWAAKVEDSKQKATLYFEIAGWQATAGDIARARQTLAVAEAAQGAPDPTTGPPWAREALASAQAKAGDAAGARRTIDEVLAVARGLKDPDARDQALRRFALGLARDGHFAAAKAAAAALDDLQSRVSIYRDIAFLQVRADDPAGARQTIEDMKAIAAGVTDPKSKPFFCNRIAEAQVKVGDLIGARQSLDAAKVIITPGGADSWLPILVVTLAKAGDVAGAKAAAVRIPDATVKATVYYQIAEVQRKAGDLPGASQTREAGKAVIAALREPKARAVALGCAAYYQRSAGNKAGARETLEAALAATAMIDDVKEKTATYLTIARDQARAGDLAGARQTIEKVKNLVAGAGLPETGPVFMCCLVALRQALLGDVAGAKATASLVPAATAQLRYVFSRIAQAQAKAGDIAGARATAESIKNPGDRLGAHSLVAAEQSRAGDLEGVRRWVESLQDAADRAAACLGAAMGLLPEEQPLDPGDLDL